jgi:hypothetical protein
MGTIGGLAVAKSLNPKLGYDTLRDLAPITQSVTVTSVLVTHPSVPAKNVRELLAIAKQGGKRLNYASSGNGTITHLAGELLKLMAKVDITHVAYKGGAPALVALVSGEVDMSYENSLIITPHIKSGRVKGLAVTGAKRSALLPDLPTIGETLKGYNAETGHRAAAHRSRQGAACAGRRRETLRTGRRTGRQHAGGIRGLHPQRNRQMGEPGQGRQDAHGLKAFIYRMNRMFRINPIIPAAIHPALIL